MPTESYLLQNVDLALLFIEKGKKFILRDTIKK